MTVADGNSVIAAATLTWGLNSYWNEYGTSNWHKEQVAGNGTTALSAPAIVQVGNDVVIAARSVTNALDVYWQGNGASGWNSEVIAGPGTTFSGPSVAQDGTATVISAEGAANSLAFYWAPSLTSAWTPETVAGRGATSWPSTTGITTPTGPIRHGSRDLHRTTQISPSMSLHGSSAARPSEA
jgi:hypothetical protein